MYLYKYICIYIYTRSSVTWICGHQDYIIINVMITFSLPKKPWQSCRLRFRWTRWDGANANPLAVEEGAGAVLGPLAMVLLACSTIRRSIEVEWCANSYVKSQLVRLAKQKQWRKLHIFSCWLIIFWCFFENGYPKIYNYFSQTMQTPTTISRSQPWNI